MNTTLHPNRDLLDPEFQSYKLSLQKGFIITTLDNDGIDLKSLPQDNFSKLNICLSSLHNCLFQDRLNPCHLYYRTSTGKIKALAISSRKEAFSSGETVFTIPSEEYSDSSVIYNTSLICLRDYALLCTGSDHVYLLHTGDRSSDVLSSWKVVYEQQVDLLSKSGYLVDAVTTRTCDGKLQIDYILLSVYKSDDEMSKTYLDWFTISGTEETWSQTRHRRLCCVTFPDHVAFEGHAESLTVRSTKPLIPLLDTSNSDIKPPSAKPQTSIETIKSEDNSQDVTFTWMQSLPSLSEGDCSLINILVKLSDQHKISDPKCGVYVVCNPCEEIEEDLNSCRLDLSIKTDAGDVKLCSARLFAPVKASGTMWTYDRETNSIDITLVKEEPGTWPHLLANPDEEKRLGLKYDEESLPTVSNIVTDEPMQSCFNVEQLEDVDMIHDNDDDDSILQRIDGTTLKAVVRAEMFGHQKLYTALTRTDFDSPDLCSHILCTRHDVDGLLWAPETSSTSWSHVATLQAFGYVLASKQNRRFVASPPIDLSQFPCTPQFVAVSDITRHIYVYWQPAASALTELRHRKSDGDSSSSSTGSKVVHVARQQVVALPDNDEIIGFAAAAEPYASCVVATRRSLFLVCLDEGEE
ncbi:unnamed protein product [Rodentolepis nana]|uniref:NudC domain-containing protein 1 n=1 Tax=Rodentolepis nana TaxID=102285 RepID=A0A0R3T7E5_RODNA|nr:unnamed protein product [Rodentolepis nana]